MPEIGEMESCIFALDTRKGLGAQDRGDWLSRYKIFTVQTVDRVTLPTLYTFSCPTPPYLEAEAVGVAMIWKNLTRPAPALSAWSGRGTD